MLRRPIRNGPHACVAALLCGLLGACTAHEAPVEVARAQCADCHQDAWELSTSPNHQTEGFPLECAGCHSEEAWTPATFDHDVFWPILGAHVGVPCESCHLDERPTTPRDCAGCHAPPGVGEAEVPHTGMRLTDACEGCHTEVAWVDLRREWHEALFPLLRGEHSGLRNDCASCHPDTTQFAVFTCTDCHEHRRSEMDDEHDDVRDYVYDSVACLRCHPNGEEDD